jgi:L-ascorbate metabolism protein UlaG (beta-lactamase superfamily)
MRIHFYGHATFHVTGEDGMSILIDPYTAGERFRYEERFEPARIALVTHEHGDHNNVAAVPGSPQVVRGAGTHTVDGITFTGIPSFHDKEQGARRGPNTIFVFDLDGIRVAHFGDQGVELDDDQYAQLTGVNVMIAPVGGGPTLEIPAMSDMVERVRPNVMIPVHYKTPKVDINLAPVDDFLSGKANVRRVGGSEIDLAAATLPQPTEIVVLDASR